MRKLDKSEMVIRRLDERHVIVGAYELHGYIQKEKVALADLPNDLVSLDDLERLGIVRRGHVSPIAEVQV